MSDHFLENIEAAFDLPSADPNRLSPITLAYIGDTVYEVFNRSREVLSGDKKPDRLHQNCSKRARAATQAAIVHLLEADFSEEEKRIFKRGRNGFVHTKAKNASVTEYHDATGLEALIGYLYLWKKTDRILEILDRGWRELGL